MNFFSVKPASVLWREPNKPSAVQVLSFSPIIDSARSAAAQAAPAAALETVCAHRDTVGGKFLCPSQVERIVSLPSRSLRQRGEGVTERPQQKIRPSSSRSLRPPCRSARVGLLPSPRPSSTLSPAFRPKDG